MPTSSASAAPAVLLTVPISTLGLIGSLCCWSQNSSTGDSVFSPKKHKYLPLNLSTLGLCVLTVDPLTASNDTSDLLGNCSISVVVESWSFLSLVTSRVTCRMASPEGLAVLRVTRTVSVCFSPICSVSCGSSYCDVLS